MTERRIFVDGVFDLFHLGHIQLFFKVKNLFPNSYIIAGISKDSDNIKYKRKSILTQKEKLLTMKHCKYIDEIILDSPWIIDVDFIKKHNIDYVIHDPLPYVSGDIDDVYKNCKKMGIFIGMNRTPNISTTDIIERIKKGHQN